MNEIYEGGYDDGYRKCSCFWGTSPGSLVRNFLSNVKAVRGLKVADLGCGEGKNAAAFAAAGAEVTAVDCSEFALKNARSSFSSAKVNWVLSDAGSFLKRAEEFDIVLMYGLLHCLRSEEEVRSLVELAICKTKPRGFHILVAFNDGPHEMKEAHPTFSPLLLPHLFYVSRYADHKVLVVEDAILSEVHPHNEIPHSHSITRLMVEI